MAFVRNCVSDTAGLMTRKKLHIAQEEGKENEAQSISSSGVVLRRTLGPFDLLFLGLGCIIGAGIFVLVGEANVVGPALSLSFAFDVIACGLSALCYTEFASKIPVSGSAYSYAYATVGEFIAFLMGWTLILSYCMSTTAIALGWTGYLGSLLESFGLDIPDYFYYLSWWEFKTDYIACLAVTLITIFLLAGVKNSAWANTIITTISILVIFFVIIAGSTKVETSNWKEFFPQGSRGVFQGASAVFFAYLGFDSIANFSEEVKKPARDLPIAIFGSLIISASLYVLVSLTVTGMVPYYSIDTNAPLSLAFEAVGWPWASSLVSLGAFAALTSSMLVTLMTAARIIFSMARDGLLPEWAACVHPKTHTQFFATISAGLLAAIPTLFVDITSIADLTSMGNLMGFTGVCFCLMILRLQEELDEAPKLRFGIIFTSLMTIAMSLGVGGATLSLYDFPIWVTICITAFLVVLPMASVCAFFWFLVPRTREKSTFLCPLVPLVPLLGIAVNMFMTFNFSLLIWILLIIWVFIGTVIYFVYSIRRSNAPSY